VHSLQVLSLLLRIVPAGQVITFSSGFPSRLTQRPSKLSVKGGLQTVQKLLEEHSAQFSPQSSHVWPEMNFPAGHRHSFLSLLNCIPGKHSEQEWKSAHFLQFQGQGLHSFSA